MRDLVGRAPGGDDPHSGADGGPSPEPTPDPDGGASGGSVSPRAGAWNYGEVTPVSTTCSALTPHGEDGDLDRKSVV